MRSRVRLRIRYASPYDPESEHVIVARDWTVGSSFFAWDFGSRAYRTFDAAYITSLQIVEGEDAAGAPFDRDRVRPSPPGRGGAPGSPRPSPPGRSGAPGSSRPSPPGRSGASGSPSLPAAVEPIALRALRRFGRSIFVLAILAGVLIFLASPERRTELFVRVLGTATPLPSSTPAPTASATATVDVRALQTATAAVRETVQQATLQAPCHPANGTCFELRGGTLVLALPQNALFLAYPAQEIDPAVARTAMRHHIRSVAARSEDGEWLLLRFTDGAELWVQSAAVSAQGALDAIPRAGTATPQATRARPRRTPMP